MVFIPRPFGAKGMGGDTVATLKEQEAKYKQETRERLTAVKHVRTEHFKNHVKMEGYAPGRYAGHSFGCDQLMKLETAFSKVQMGFNPNRGRGFLVMNLKTSRYDTIDSQYQKEIKEEQMKPLNLNGFQNRAFASQQRPDAVVLIEKSDAGPWSESTIRPHYGKGNLEALQKALPFFSKNEGKEKISDNRLTERSLQKKVQDNVNKGMFENNRMLRERQRDLLYEDNLLFHFIRLKEAEGRYFFRKLNFAFDIQKKEMFDYYKTRKEETRGREGWVNEQLPEDGEDNE